MTLSVLRPSLSTINRDTLWYGIATIAERAVSFLLLPLLTKTLSQDFYGVWTQIILSLGLVPGILLVGFQTTAVRYLAGKSEARYVGAVFHGMLSLVLLNSIIGLTLATIFAKTISIFMFGDERFVDFARVLGLFWTREAVCRAA